MMYSSALDSTSVYSSELLNGTDVPLNQNGYPQYDNFIT